MAQSDFLYIGIYYKNKFVCFLQALYRSSYSFNLTINVDIALRHRHQSFFNGKNAISKDIGTLNEILMYSSSRNLFKDLLGTYTNEKIIMDYVFIKLIDISELRKIKLKKILV